MAYNINYGALQRRTRRYQVGGPPPSGRVTAVLVGLCVVMVLGLFGWGFYESNQFSKERHKQEQAWDANTGRPQAAKITAGHTAVAPHSLSHVSDYWDRCSKSGCYDLDFQHYPVAYWLTSLMLDDHHCFTGRSKKPVNTLQAAASGDNYVVTLQADHRTVQICQKPDFAGLQNAVMLWSDDLPPGNN